MYRQGVHLISVLLIIASLTPLGISQTSQPQAQSQAAKDSFSQPLATFQSSTRMVTLEVVAKDHQGHHAGGLTATDFQVFEQSPSRGKARHEQKIAAFREVRITDLATQSTSEMQVPAGVYTNAVTLDKDPVPPTILLVDGLNTDPKFQAQLHVQMVRMLKSLPNNGPVAVFLFGNRLRVLQEFTTDPRLLQAALQKATTTAGVGKELDQRDDPDAIATKFEQINAASSPPLPAGPGAAAPGPLIDQGIIDAIKRFQQEIYASSVDTRVQHTVEALASIGRHVAGYPGRKNLLWISTSFPIYLSPLRDDSGKPITDRTGVNDSGYRNYWPQLRVLVGVLSEAKVAVYPVNPAGVQAPSFFDSETRVAARTGRAVGDSLQRETLMRGNEQDTMEVIAQGTGGQVCTGTNDLGDCIRKAVDDSSSFFEIAYYPDSENWNGEYRRVSVVVRQPGVHLAYRQGYFARPEGNENSKDQKAELQQAACEDYLNATAISLTAKSMPPDSPEKLKFYLRINESRLTPTPTLDGGRELNLAVAVCTLDQVGWPFQFMSDMIRRNFNSKEYQSLSTNGLPHIISIPGPKPAAIRILVKDIPSGRIGSVYIKVDDTLAVPSAAATEKGMQQTAQ